MEKKARREKKLAEKRKKKQEKSGSIKNEDDNKTIDINTTITLDMLTDPDKR